MKKSLIISATLLASLSLVGCNSMNNAMNDTGNFATSTVGTGMHYTTSVVGTGVGVVTGTGAAIGRGFGTVVGTGTGIVTGQRVYYKPTGYYHKTQVIYRHGHHYMLKNGRYVRMD